MKMPGKCTGPKYLSKMLENGERVLEVVIWQEEDGQWAVLIWCRKCSGYARKKMVPKWTNCCQPEQVGTKERDMMLKRIQVLADGRVSCEGGKRLQD